MAAGRVYDCGRGQLPGQARLKRRIAHVNTSTESLAQLGLEWIPSKNLRLALAGKRRGIGPDGNRVSANEVGVWADLRLF